MLRKRPGNSWVTHREAVPQLLPELKAASVVPAAVFGALRAALPGEEAAGVGPLAAERVAAAAAAVVVGAGGEEGAYPGEKVVAPVGAGALRGVGLLVRVRRGGGGGGRGGGGRGAPG